MVTFVKNREAYNEKYVAGMYVKKRVLTSTKGAAIHIPGSPGIIHLQFRRFAGCPVCNLHLQKMAKEWTQLEAAGITEVIVFHSTREELTKYADDLPFHVIGDPEKKLYKAFGVESSPYAVLHPRAFFPIAHSVFNNFKEYLSGKKPLPPLRPAGGSLGLPADFLIREDGKILEFNYGRHADDQWSVSDVLEFVAKHDCLSKGLGIIF
jgi:peroxiredoxin